ncbi:MAG: CU044_2847 family protein [Methylococcales bacterium]
MASKLIELEDGILMEVDVPEQQIQQISGGGLEITQVSRSINAIESILLKVCQPVANVLTELNKDMLVNEVKVQIELGLEAEGNFFIAKGKTNASLTIKLKLTPKPQL